MEVFVFRTALVDRSFYLSNCISRLKFLSFELHLEMTVGTFSEIFPRYNVFLVECSNVEMMKPLHCIVYIDLFLLCRQLLRIYRVECK